MSEREFSPEPQPEMSEEARQAVLLFQEAKRTQDPNRRRELVAEFLNAVRTLVENQTLRHPFYHPENVARFERSFFEHVDRSEILIVGSGSSGRRIRFDSRQPDSLEESPDNLTHWMYYRKPNETDWASSGDFWERFVANFGDWIVSLDKEIKST